MKDIRIHDLHHHVLRSWNILRAKCPAVISFDHHLDILLAFLRYSANNGFPADAGTDLEKDISRLQHDEHFDYALKYNIISKAVIISHTPVVTECPAGLTVLYNGDFAEDEPLNSERFQHYSDMAVEDCFLEQFVSHFPTENYILDIDCDYFKTEKSLNPEKSSIFRKLVQNAEMITISREDDWVRILTFENPSFFTPDHIVEKLGF